MRVAAHTQAGATAGLGAGASILVGCSFVFGDDPREDPVLTRFPRGRSEVVGSVYGDIDSAMLLSPKAELIVSL
jgi:hypothetical protein